MCTPLGSPALQHVYTAFEPLLIYFLWIVAEGRIGTDAVGEELDADLIQKSHLGNLATSTKEDDYITHM